MSLGLSLDVKVAGCSIDLEETCDHTAWMICIFPRVFDFVTGCRESLSKLFVFLGLDGPFSCDCYGTDYKEKLILL